MNARAHTNTATGMLACFEERLVQGFADVSSHRDFNLKFKFAFNRGFLRSTVDTTRLSDLICLGNKFCLEFRTGDHTIVIEHDYMTITDGMSTSLCRELRV